MESNEAILGYRIPQQIEKILDAERTSGFSSRLIHAPPILGLRWGSFIVCEKYASRIEPPLPPHPRRITVMMWRPIGHSGKPSGWWRFPVSLDYINQTGYALVSDGRAYHDQWTRRAREYRAQFLARSHDMVEVSQEVYLSHFPTAGKFRGIQEFVHDKVKRYARAFGDDLVCYLVQHTGKIMAGLAVAYAPSQNYTLHVSAFTNRSNATNDIGVGMIDHWHQEALKRNIAYLDFGCLFKRGDPQAWRGFADFKKQFALHILDLPPTYIKIFLPALPKSFFK